MRNLIEELERARYHLTSSKHKETIDNAIEMLEKQPKADFVEVVRCKDCMFYFPPFCNRPINKPCQTHAIMPNDYCSYGERKDT